MFQMILIQAILHCILDTSNSVSLRAAVEMIQRNYLPLDHEGRVNSHYLDIIETIELDCPEYIVVKNRTGVIGGTLFPSAQFRSDVKSWFINELPIDDSSSIARQGLNNLLTEMWGPASEQELLEVV